MRLPLFSAALAVLGFYASFAAAQASSPTLGMVTGPKTGTYIAIGHDIARTAARESITVMVKESGGSIDNIKRINSAENAALGIVQSDVLGFLSRSRNPETIRIASRLRMVLPLYKEEVHVLARKEIASFKDLQGKKVVVGEEGSGHMLTAVNLLSMMEVKVADTLRLPPPEGVVAVLEGKADAVVFVGGKPVKLFKNMEQLATPENAKFTDLLKHVHFLPLQEPRMLEEYPVAEITPQDYTFMEQPVPTIAVRAVLMTFDFAEAKSVGAKKRCEAIGKVAQAVRSQIDTLKDSGHPKWKEVDLNADPGLWKMDRCSWANADTTPSAPLGNDLLNIIGKSDGR